jgi:Domain of unknown function (DUF4126)
MNLVTALGRIVPFAFASGVNLYATIAVVGLCSRFHLIALPEQFRAFDNPVIIGAAIAMYLIEFVADKIPWLDSLWDAVHTVIRPVGGAIVAVSALGDASPAMQTAAALFGGSVAMTSHLTKAGARAAANTSPEPFSNWILSLLEDVFVVGLTWFAVQHPYWAAAITIALLAAIVAFASVIIRAARRRFSSRESLVSGRQ